MITRILSAGVFGIEAYTTQIEVNLRLGLPSYTLVGLPANVIKEGFVRVRAALEQVGFPLPARKITINLAPADVRKDGSAFDLPIAVALLASCHVFDESLIQNLLWLGELSLDGSIRPVLGSLPMTLHSQKQGLHGIVLPLSCAQEASAVKGFSIYGVSHLSQIIKCFQKKQPLPLFHCQQNPILPNLKNPDNERQLDLQQIRGNKIPKRALEIAAAGAHHLLLMGPPGTGKSMLAQSLPSILPKMTEEESLEITSLYSCAGLLKDPSLLSFRPFRAPHHGITLAGLIGGGVIPRPGEISLAHHGVLFLDELPEFHKTTLESLRQPLEEHKITLVRSRYVMTYPAFFSLVAAMNPCPCGYDNSSIKNCICDVSRILSYRARISGPLLDRFDLHVFVPQTEYTTLLTETGLEESSMVISERVQNARQIQRNRYLSRKNISCNAQLHGDHILSYANLRPQAERLLTTYSQKNSISNRSFYRIIKVARTIADLETSHFIEVSHIAEACTLRILDQPLS